MRLFTHGLVHIRLVLQANHIMNDEKKQIALLGCGLMGSPMARRLLAAGYPLTVWNRTRAKADALIVDRARVPPTPPQSVAQAELVIPMLEPGGCGQNGPVNPGFFQS